MDERAYLQSLSKLTPGEIAEEVMHADEQQERVLRIYLTSEQFDRIHALATGTLSRGGPPLDKLGNVVVLHGILGGLLSEFGTSNPELIWVQILNLIAGKFDQLSLDSAGKSQNDVRASGIYLRFYGSLLVSLNQNWNVRPFFYDWRRDIRLAADDLNQMLASQFPNQPVHLVAHSMGGLVARSFIVRHPDRWNVAGPDGRRGNLIMLGTPNYGSFAVPRLLLGTNEVLSIVSKIDLFHRRPILDTAKTFVGAYQMMPTLGHIDGLDVLYRASTYNVSPIPHALLDDAKAFQAEIAGVVDPTRMAYVAGYNRVTPAAIRDVTQLANDNGYVLSTRGDGTVPHDLGLLPGVAKFFVDEEHMKLPSNTRVQAAMNDLLTTLNQPNENNLFKGLGPEFDDQRGAGGNTQQVLLASQVARRAVKEQQAAALSNALLSRGSLQSNAISPEEQALADLLLQHEPLRLSVGGQPIGGGAIAADSVESGGTAKAISNAAPPPVETHIRIRVLPRLIEDVAVGDTGDNFPIDCFAVGHYLRVRPTGAEHGLDVAISSAIRPGERAQDTILSSFHERGILRGDLGVPFFLPDPRKGHENVLVAVAGMGPTGEFGLPELTLLARELCWSSAQLGKKHLATVLIGAGANNLSVSDAVQAWLQGIHRALASATGAGVPCLEAVTFVMWPDPDSPPAGDGSLTGDQASLVNALQREIKAATNEVSPLHHLRMEFIDPPPVVAPSQELTRTTASTRINIDFDPSGVYRYSAMTNSASVAERVIKIDPKRIKDASARLLTTTCKEDRYKLGKFLLDFLFPRDLRAQLTGSAPVVLQLNNEAAKVYWEVTAQPLADDDPIDPEDNAQGMPFLGLQRGLTRQLRTILAPPPEPPPPAGRILRVLIVADGNKEMRLPGAQKEAQTLMALFDRVNAQNKDKNGNTIVYTALVGPSKATTLDVLLKINDQPPFDVLHYAGHCVFDEKNPLRSGLLFSGDDRLTAADLDRVDRTPKFIFANACESGIMPSRPDLSSPELPAVFAEAFFKKGVANFICTAWPVADAPASAFAEVLYKNLLGDGVQIVPMYEALRKARREIAATTTWGAYQHYGDPYFRLFGHQEESK
jgi:pimeloyl-ACP methyl ester carboxylesterase